MSEPEVLTEVPASLKLLIHMVMQCFYGNDYAIVMDKLIHHPCIKEDDLLELLRFERKQLRSVISNLRNEKFVRQRMRVETDAESSRTTRHNYYFISYSVFINVVRYKLHHMQRKIQTNERDATSRSSYSCPDCQKKFTDLEVDRLVTDAGTLECSYCSTELETEQPTSATNDTRSLLAKFNEQLKPVYDLLATVEAVRFAPELLEPEPTDYKRTRTGVSQAVDSGGVRGSVWSGELSRNNPSFGYSEKQVTISLDSGSAASRSEAAVKALKEVPVWISHSTVDHSAVNIQQGAGSTENSRDGLTPSTAAADRDDIMRTLLSHEKSSASSSSAVQLASAVAAASTQSSSSDSDMDDEQITEHAGGDGMEEMDSDEYEADEDESMLVRVGNEMVPYSSVTEQMVACMSPAEKDEYIRVGQQLYDQFHH